MTPSPELSRRTVVVGGAVVLGTGLAATACAGGPPPEPAAAPAAAAGAVLGPTSDVPVGGAKIFSEQKVVVTQAAAGTFAGFSTKCPHAGCAVAQVQGTSLVCPCHGSEFALDGSVTKGPAQAGLTPATVTVKGTDLTVG